MELPFKYFVPLFDLIEFIKLLKCRTRDGGSSFGVTTLRYTPWRWDCTRCGKDEYVISKGYSNCSLFKWRPICPDTVADAKTSTSLKSSPPSNTGITSTSITTALLLLCRLISPVSTGFSNKISLMPLDVVAISKISTIFSTTVLSNKSERSNATARSTTRTCVGTSATFAVLISVLLLLSFLLEFDVLSGMKSCFFAPCNVLICSMAREKRSSTGSPPIGIFFLCKTGPWGTGPRSISFSNISVNVPRSRSMYVTTRTIPAIAIRSSSCKEPRSWIPSSSSFSFSFSFSSSVCNIPNRNPFNTFTYVVWSNTLPSGCVLTLEHNGFRSVLIFSFGTLMSEESLAKTIKISSCVPLDADWNVLVSSLSLLSSLKLMFSLI